MRETSLPCRPPASLRGNGAGGIVGQEPITPTAPPLHRYSRAGAKEHRGDFGGTEVRQVLPSYLSQPLTLHLPRQCSTGQQSGNRGTGKTTYARLCIYIYIYIYIYIHLHLHIQTPPPGSDTSRASRHSDGDKCRRCGPLRLSATRRYGPNSAVRYMATELIPLDTQVSRQPPGQAGDPLDCRPVSWGSNPIIYIATIVVLVK